MMRGDERGPLTEIRADIDRFHKEMLVIFDGDTAAAENSVKRVLGYLHTTTMTYTEAMAEERRSVLRARVANK